MVYETHVTNMNFLILLFRVGGIFDTSRYVDWLRDSFLPPITASLSHRSANQSVWETDQVSNIAIHRSSLEHWIGSQLKK